MKIPIAKSFNLNRLNLSLSLSLLIFFSACSPSVVFYSPQPANKRDMKKFPSRIQGQYLENRDSTLYIIDRNQIREYHEEDFGVSMAEADTSSEFKLLDNSILLYETGEEIPVTITNDSVYGTLSAFDTVFRISPENILRKSMGYYFLNSKGNENEWMINKLQFGKDGTATMCVISEEDEMDEISQITEVVEEKNDQGKTTKYIIKPDKKEFKTIIKNGHFQDCNAYHRILVHVKD